MLKFGKGCQKNEAEAMKTLELAAKNGHEKAKDIVTKLKTKEQAEREAAVAKKEEEDRVKQFVAEGLRPKTEDEEGGTARRRGRRRGGPRGIPSQGLPEPPPKPPQQQPPPKTTRDSTAGTT
jgi:hypothetical protein